MSFEILQESAHSLVSSKNASAAQLGQEPSNEISENQKTQCQMNTASEIEFPIAITLVSR